MRCKQDSTFYGAFFFAVSCNIIALTLLFVPACSIVTPGAMDAITTRDIAVAYADLDEAIDTIAELSAPEEIAGHEPVINDHHKALMGVQVRKAKGFIDTASEQVRGGETSSDEYDQAITIISDLQGQFDKLTNEKGVSHEP